MYRVILGGLVAFPLYLGANSYESNCLTCHFNERQLGMFFSRYSVKHSSEKRIKQAIESYLTYPKASQSVMPFGFLNNFGVKKPTTLDKKSLQEAINIYYQKFTYTKRIVKE
jgi:hypothetical protein